MKPTVGYKHTLDKKSSARCRQESNGWDNQIQTPVTQQAKDLLASKFLEEKAKQNTKQPCGLDQPNSRYTNTKSPKMKTNFRDEISLNSNTQRSKIPSNKLWIVVEIYRNPQYCFQRKIKAPFNILKIGSLFPAPLSLLLSSRCNSKTHLRDPKESYLPIGALGDVLNKSIDGPSLGSTGTRTGEYIQRS